MLQTCINTENKCTRTQTWSGSLTGCPGGITLYVVDDELQYLIGHRYYDPEIGVFTSTDPAEEFFNAYSYCDGDPVNLIDPDGLQSDDWQYDEQNGWHKWDVSSGQATLTVSRSGHGGLYGDGSSSADHDDNPVQIINGKAVWTKKTAVDNTIPGSGSGNSGGGSFSKQFANALHLQMQNSFVFAEPAMNLSLLAVSFFTPAPEVAIAGWLSKPVGGLRALGLKDAHHIVQDAAVRELSGYSTTAARGIQLRGPSNVSGTAHFMATQVQRQAGGGTLGAELRIGYKALRRAGINKGDARQLTNEAAAYFESIGADATTVTRIPGNR